MSVSSGERNFATFIAKIEGRSDNDISEPAFVRDYRKAQLLIAQGLFQDSLPYLQEAMDTIRPQRADFLWERTYVAIGGLLANTLDYFGQYDDSEAIYKEMLQTNVNGEYISGYAIFLHKRKKDFVQAQRFYLKALALNPTHSSIHLKYAGFLRHVRQDVSNAEKHYKLAISSDPSNADALGNYASFLHGELGNMEDAAQYYEHAVIADATHVNNLCNYGLFLSEVHSKYAAAEKHYRSETSDNCALEITCFYFIGYGVIIYSNHWYIKERRAALELDPMHVNTLYNIAVMFDTHCDRKIEAETMYRRALLEDPVHTFALYNLAVLLEERLEIEPCMVHNSSTQNSFEASRSSSIPNISHDSVGILDPSYLIEDLKGVNNMESNAFKDVAMGNIGSEEREALIKEIRSLHEQSMHLNPFDVPTIADYGRFLRSNTDDIVVAEEVLKLALSFDEDNEIALYNLGIIYHSKKDLASSGGYLIKLIVINPNHIGGLQQLARVRVDIVMACTERDQGPGHRQQALKGAMDCYERAISIINDPGRLVMEYMHVGRSLGDKEDKLRAVAAVRALMKVRGQTLTPGDADSVQEQLTALLVSIQSDVQDSADDGVIGSSIVLPDVP